MNNQNEVDSGQFKVTASTYNRIYTVGNDNFFVGTANFGKEAIYQVDPELPPINHALLPPERNATPFHQYKGNISSEIPKATVFYAYTHGQNAKLGDSSANAAYEAGKWLTDAEIETAVNQKTVDQPAYNLVVLMACHCGDTETLAAKFKVNALPNVAFLGWNSLIKDEKNTADWAQHLFNRLAAGDVLHDAIGRANDWNQDGLADESVKNGSGGNAAPIVVGDRFRYKLHGVFQGAGTQWYQ